mgnify:FL=1
MTRLSPLNYAFRLLSFRMRSKDEMRERLIKKGYTESEVNEVIEKLERLNYLNDAEFARLWVKNRVESKPLGRALMRRELKQKGIAPDVIKNVLDESLKGYDEYEVAKELVLKKISKSKTRDDRFLQRFSGYLARRGFSYEVIQKVLGCWCDE